LCGPVYLKLFPPTACNLVAAQPRCVGVQDAPLDPVPNH